MVELQPNSVGFAAEIHPAPANSALREKSAEFEGILLSEVLQKLSECYRIPDSEGSDSTGESFQSFATSALGRGLAHAGGVGIGDMLVRSLTQKQQASPPSP